MDKKFLDKVVDQIVRETRMDRDKRSIYTPFSFIYRGEMRFKESFSGIISFFLWGLSFSFSQHCEEVYGLNKHEIDYVWEEYKHIIIDKINNG